ncbi:hypothetical protein JCM24511_07019 [Saitozyma sp. JCM 24511]|nr:hypothetical protein JCM24511_07019 [Saitozyma sp. JCM 24511]
MPARPSDSQGAGGTGSAPRLKLVIRRLPPALPEETFWKSVAPFVTDQTCQWKRYVKGRAADAFGAHPIHSRAYCLMTTPDALVAFHRGFDGHVFRSKTGAEYQAVVEYAPLQKTPLKTKVKVDARQGTIDDDPDYKSFLESLNAPATKPALDVSVPPPQPTSTPLLDHLRAHAKSGGKASRKAKAESSSTDIARNSALASVSAAAARRAPQNQGGVVMVAGKGRDVKITASGSGDVPATATEGKGKQKEGGGGKGRGKKGKGGGGGGGAAEPAAKGQKQGSSKSATDKAATATATAAGLTPAGGNHQQIRPSDLRAPPEEERAVAEAEAVDADADEAEVEVKVPAEEKAVVAMRKEVVLDQRNEPGPAGEEGETGGNARREARWWKSSLGTQSLIVEVEVAVVAVEVEGSAAEWGAEPPRPFFRVKRGSMLDSGGSSAYWPCIGPSPLSPASLGTGALLVRPSVGQEEGPLGTRGATPSGPVRAVAMWRLPPLSRHLDLAL